jgi:hypothetical protein
MPTRPLTERRAVICGHIGAYIKWKNGLAGHDSGMGLWSERLIPFLIHAESIFVV